MTHLQLKMFNWIQLKWEAFRTQYYFLTVLGKLPPSPNSNTNPKPNPDPVRGAIEYPSTNPIFTKESLFLRLILRQSFKSDFYFWLFLILAEAATRGVLCKKIVLEIWQNSQENNCVKVSFLIKLQALKKRLWHRCFPVNFVRFLRTPFLQNTSGRLLLYMQSKSNKYA